MSRHDRSVRTGSDRASLYDEITSKTIAELEALSIPAITASQSYAPASNQKISLLGIPAESHLSPLGISPLAKDVEKL